MPRLLRGAGAGACRRPRRHGGLAAVALVVAATMLAGCGLGDGFGALMVDPASYGAYRCRDLATEARALAKREATLRNLMERARQGNGGAVIGAMAYGDTYGAVREREKLVRRAEAQKGCPLAPASERSRITAKPAVPLRAAPPGSAPPLTLGPAP